MELLTSPGREAFLVQDHDADSFMRELALDGLGQYLPRIVLDPLADLGGSLSRIMPFPQEEGSPQAGDPVEDAKAHVQRAQEAIQERDAEGEKSSRLLILAARMAALTRDVRALDELRDGVPAQSDNDLRRAIGSAYLRLATDAEGRGDLTEAIGYVKQADGLGVDQPAWLELIWGDALSGQARMKEGEEADRLFTEACEKYEQALAIKPDMHEALNNWGAALSARAELKEGEEADSLYAQAHEKYAQALVIKPDMHEALNNWGAALSAQAKLKEGEEADSLYAQAHEKYAQALRIKPDKHEALSNWGAALSNQARMKKAKEADRLFAQAQEKYQQALAIRPDYSDALFNMACTEALQGHTGRAVALLKKWAAGHPAARAKIDQETDFDAIREDPLFIEFCQTLPD
jgi:Tfp pilus assembly protein PilF